MNLKLSSFLLLASAPAFASSLQEKALALNCNKAVSVSAQKAFLAANNGEFVIDTYPEYQPELEDPEYQSGSYLVMVNGPHFREQYAVAFRIENNTCIAEKARQP